MMHVSNYNVSMCVQFGVAAGAGDLGHTVGGAATGLRVSEFRLSPDPIYQFSQNCLKLTRIIILLGYIAGDDPVRS